MAWWNARDAAKRVNNRKGAIVSQQTREKLSIALTKDSIKKHELYDVYSAMIDRCHNPNDGGYARYGGRGIIVCERWRLESDIGFINFLADIGDRPPGKSPGGRALYSIERRDNNGPYSPDNCYWATVKQQIANRRQARQLTEAEQQAKAKKCSDASLKYWNSRTLKE